MDGGTDFVAAYAQQKADRLQHAKELREARKAAGDEGRVHNPKNVAGQLFNPKRQRLLVFEDGEGEETRAQPSEQVAPQSAFDRSEQVEPTDVEVEAQAELPTEKAVDPPSTAPSGENTDPNPPAPVGRPDVLRRAPLSSLMQKAAQTEMCQLRSRVKKLQNTVEKLKEELDRKEGELEVERVARDDAVADAAIIRARRLEETDHSAQFAEMGCLRQVNERLLLELEQVKEERDRNVAAFQGAMEEMQRIRWNNSQLCSLVEEQGCECSRCEHRAETAECELWEVKRQMEVEVGRTNQAVEEVERLRGLLGTPTLICVPERSVPESVAFDSVLPPLCFVFEALPTPQVVLCPGEMNDAVSPLVFSAVGGHAVCVVCMGRSGLVVGEQGLLMACAKACLASGDCSAAKGWRVTFAVSAAWVHRGGAVDVLGGSGDDSSRLRKLNGIGAATSVPLENEEALAVVHRRLVNAGSSKWPLFISMSVEVCNADLNQTMRGRLSIVDLASDGSDLNQVDCLKTALRISARKVPPPRHMHPIVAALTTAAPRHTRVLSHDHTTPPLRSHRSENPLCGAHETSSVERGVV